jgi:hypothetical protein
VKTGCSGPAALTGPEALEAVVGNTLVDASDPRGDLVAFLGQDGTAKLLRRGETVPLTRKWRFEQGRLCVMEESGSGSECFVLEVNDTNATLTVDGQVIGPMSILPGNARNLN